MVPMVVAMIEDTIAMITLDCSALMIFSSAKASEYHCVVQAGIGNVEYFDELNDIRMTIRMGANRNR
jgi:hypothetical protein